MMISITRHRDALNAMGLFLFALALRAGLAAFTQFDGLYGQDAFAYYEYARRLLDSTSRLHMPAPFFWPLGFPALVALAFVPAGISPLAGQWVSMLTGALVAPLVYLLTREVSIAISERRAGDETSYVPRAGALVAGLVAAVSGQLLQSSIVLMADAAATMWATFSALALLRYAKERRLRWWLAAALSLMLAAFTRWIYGALLIPWALVFLFTWRKASGESAARLRSASTHAIIVVACALPFCIAQWGALVPSTSLNHAWLTAWNPINAIGHVFDNPDGHFDYPLPVGIFYAQPVAHPYYIFPLLLPLILCGLWASRRAPAAHRIVAVGWPLAVYVFLAGIPYENFRFGLALWPPLVVLGGAGVDWVWSRAAVKREAPKGRLKNGHAQPQTASGQGATPRWVRPAVRAAVALSLLGMLFWSVRAILPFIAVKNEQRAIVLAVARQVPANGTVVALGLRGYFQVYAEDVTAAELYNETPESLLRFVCATSPAYLLIEPHSIKSQWANREPDVNVRWLEANAGLREIARYDTQVLYQIGGACA